MITIKDIPYDALCIILSKISTEDHKGFFYSCKEFQELTYNRKFVEDLIFSIFKPARKFTHII